MTLWIYGCFILILHLIVNYCRSFCCMPKMLGLVGALYWNQSQWQRFSYIWKRPASLLHLDQTAQKTNNKIASFIPSSVEDRPTNVLTKRTVPIFTKWLKTWGGVNVGTSQWLQGPRIQHVVCQDWTCGLSCLSAKSCQEYMTLWSPNLSQWPSQRAGILCSLSPA